MSVNEPKVSTTTMIREVKPGTKFRMGDVLVEVSKRSRKTNRVTLIITAPRHIRITKLPTEPVESE